MRCVCCDRQLKPSEIIWLPDQNRHEEMCSKCRWNVHNDLLSIGFKKDKIIVEDSNSGDDS